MDKNTQKISKTKILDVYKRIKNNPVEIKKGYRCRDLVKKTGLEEMVVRSALVSLVNERVLFIRSRLARYCHKKYAEKAGMNYMERIGSACVPIASSNLLVKTNGNYMR